MNLDVTKHSIVWSYLKEDRQLLGVLWVMRYLNIGLILIFLKLAGEQWRFIAFYNIAFYSQQWEKERAEMALKF